MNRILATFDQNSEVSSRWSLLSRGRSLADVDESVELTAVVRIQGHLLGIIGFQGKIEEQPINNVHSDVQSFI